MFILALFIVLAAICNATPLPLPVQSATSLVSNRESIPPLSRHSGIIHTIFAWGSPPPFTTISPGGEDVLTGEMLVDGSVQATSSVDQELSPSMTTFIGTSMTAVSSPTDESPISSDATTEPSSMPNFATPQPTKPEASLHASVIPIFVGSAIGTLALLGLTVLLVACRRHARARTAGSDKASWHWFNSDEKEDIIVSVHVPPPAVPLKGILIQNSSCQCRSPAELHPDRVSLTSSQLSVLVNNLPKSYDSGLEDGVLDEVRDGDQRSPIQVSRIGPSPSDFIANLFGHSHSFTNSASTASETLSLPSSESPRVISPIMSHRDDLTSLANLSSPVFPPPVASPNLGIANGPRGHGLVLTGDQNVLIPSFAQWHYQRVMARGRNMS